MHRSRSGQSSVRRLVSAAQLAVSSSSPADLRQPANAGRTGGRARLAQMVSPLYRKTPQRIGPLWPGSR
jgi:hypothetical protein